MDNMKKYEDLLLQVATAEDTEAFIALTIILKRLRKSDKMEKALKTIIDLQRQLARDRFGDAYIAYNWAEVEEAIKGLED